MKIVILKLSLGPNRVGVKLMKVQAMKVGVQKDPSMLGGKEVHCTGKIMLFNITATMK